MRGISFIVANYNAGTYLSEAVHSIVQARPHVPYEIIVVDDGSTTNETHTALDFLTRQQISALTVHRLPSNRGQSSARNHALIHARYDYIMAVDADDKLTPAAAGHIDEAIAMLEKNPHCFTAYARAHLFGVRYGPMILSEYSSNELAIRNMIPVFGIYRKDDALRIGGYREDMRFCEDWELWVALANKHCERGDSPLAQEFRTAAYLYRLHDNGNNVSAARRIELPALYRHLTERGEHFYQQTCGTTDAEKLHILHQDTIPLPTFVNRLTRIFDISSRYGTATCMAEIYKGVQRKIQTALRLTSESLPAPNIDIPR